MKLRKRCAFFMIFVLIFALAFAFSGCGESGTAQDGKDDDKGGEQVERNLRNLPADVKYGVRKENYEIESDGIKLYGERYRPEKAGKFPAVILCHGYNNHYTDFAKEGERLAQRGYVAYAFDFAGAQTNGKSTGRTKDDYSPLTMKEDLIIAIKHFKEEVSFVDGSQIFVWGGSQGGFVAGLTAADDRVKDDIAALALYFPAFNIPDDHRNDPEETVPFMGYYLNAAYIRSIKELDPFAVIPAYKGDVCILWGTEDALVKRTYIDQAVAAYGADRTELTVIDGAGHGFGGEVLSNAIDTVLKFLEARTYETL